MKADPRLLCGIAGGVYIGSVGALFVGGAGIPAAYLAMPAWGLVGFIILALNRVFGTPVEQFFFSSAGNLIALVTSATLNVLGAWFVVIEAIWPDNNPPSNSGLENP